VNACRAAVSLAVLLASCAAPPIAPRDEELAARVDAELARRGAGSDLLQLIHNVVRHEPGPPPAAPGMVRELFARPLAAADADALFRASVPAELAAFVPPLAASAEVPLEALVARYVEELAGARALLRKAADAIPIDTAAILKELESGFDSPAALVTLTRIDRALVQRANAHFLRATARFVAGLRAARFPEHAQRFDTAIGVVSIGTRGNDQHGTDAAVIIDPGGDDVYERAPLTGGDVRAVFDLAGNDRYVGADVVVHGLAALVDFSGDDRYAADGPGQAAAVVGASLVVDFSGNDTYQAALFAQGAAAFGFAALLDFEGNDQYTVRAAGQGFALADGVGLLWDRSGNDRYSAGGMEDAYGRGGGVSFAQGAAFGFRTMLAGGIGILRDDAGDDTYEAQMFAQGTGYYYGVGLAWDRAGDDRWQAVRYAQGNGVHEAVGVLRDESGDDQYVLSYGVGQGMGLDLGLGLLYDAAGSDRYEATVHAQANATVNGIGLLFDAAGMDEWRMSADPRAWGRAEPGRGLPSLGLLLYAPARASFLREGKPVPPPQGGGIEAPPQPEKRRCPEPPTAAALAQVPFPEAVRSLEFLFRGGEADPGAHAYVLQRLAQDLERALMELPRDDFTIDWILGNALPCVLRQAAPEEALAMWAAMERVMRADPASPFAMPIALALRERPAPAAQLDTVTRALARHPSCAVRAAAVVLENSAAAAQTALRSSCWLLQASALRVLQKLGEAPPRSAPLPSFLHR
jgi:hypothetical protein